MARNVYGKFIDNAAGYVFKQAERAILPDHVALSAQRCLTSATLGVVRESSAMK